ncbi:MAG: Slp family lipoprotein [Desulfuromonadaceae bacterium]|nr:Slp family lipoprotein [Desulfuromonadaceae bacterium]MDD2854056.1 Slp family lipoprotein [Desulfuromonadaceae bacterium]
MKNYLLFFVSFLLIITTGCSHVMSEAGLATVDKSVMYKDIKSKPEILAGKKVLVGGIIAETRSSGDVMQLEVVQLDLLTNGVPDDLSISEGRFLVVSGELLDPMIYRAGLLVTVIGEIKGQKVQKLESSDYRYPVISAKEIRLFRASDSSTSRPANPYQNEFGDGRFMLRPPGGVFTEPAKP